MAVDDEDHPFLTARHVDDLTDAVRALNHAIHTLTKAQSAILSNLQKIADNTSNLPALMEVLMGKTNGDVHDVADRDGP
jgi:hypothetical protein